MILLYNGRIYTPGMHSSAILIEGERIAAIGSDDELLAVVDSKAEKINLNGKSVWPGLTDSHLHFEMYSLGLNQVDCETSTIDECLKRVALKATALPEGKWIMGQGWNQNEWNGKFGTAAQLDAVSAHHPAFLSDKSIHSVWVNTKTLELGGINRETPDPAGGTIQRDEQGNPTGILFENAISLVEKWIPPTSPADLQAAMLIGQQELHKVGLTSIHDFDPPTCFSALQVLHSEDKLSLRVAKGIPFDRLEDAIRLGLRSGFGDDLLFISSIKMFADGALGPQTAAMFKPYEENPSNKGTLLLTADEVFEAGIKAVSNGLSLAIHAIGDRATNEVLNGYAMLREYESRNSLPMLPHRVEHLQLLHPDDLQKAADLQIVASMQPIHTTSDMFTADKHWGKRAKYAYAFSSLLKYKTRLIFGSDAPVESPNPFWGMHAAVTRRRQNGAPGESGWNPEQRISLEQALEAYTTSPASVVGKANIWGLLQPGYYADLIVLPTDPFAMDTQELYKIQPEDVMVGGKWVYHKG
jgi:predicted amidohydrolase YtcJ